MACSLFGRHGDPAIRLRAQRDVLLAACDKLGRLVELATRVGFRVAQEEVESNETAAMAAERDAILREFAAAIEAAAEGE